MASLLSRLVSRKVILRVFVACIILILLTGRQFAAAKPVDGAPGQDQFAAQGSSFPVYLPIIHNSRQPLPVVNMAYMSGSDVKDANYHQAAIFWFGKVGQYDNYADIRLGYDTQEVYVRFAVMDRYTLIDPNPTLNHLAAWDALSLYLDTGGHSSSTLTEKMYHFVAEVGTKTTGTNRQVVYQGSSTGWRQVPLTFYSSSGWYENGYVLTFHLPFSSLGLASYPAEGTEWGLAAVLHDRDDTAGTIYAETRWPQDFDSLRSTSWSQIHFGLPGYTPVQVSHPQTYTIRQGVNGAIVPDGVVGGNTVCGEGVTDFWHQWGNRTWIGARDMNVQNEGYMWDWPCFSKFYITFPLDPLPRGKIIQSARLLLYQSGQSVGYDTDPPEAVNSLIQVLEVGQSWDEATLTWNNGPLPIENVSRAWVGPLASDQWGTARSWDLSRAVARAYADGRPLRLAVYSADAYSSQGKYFLSSDTMENVRPALEVTLGDP